MWLLLVTVAAYAVSVEAGYDYNAPNTYNTPHGLPGVQTSYNHYVMNLRPRQIKVPQNIQEENKATSYSVAYKDNVYSKNGNVENNLPNINQFNTNYNNPQGYGNFYPDEKYSILSVPNLQSNGAVNFNNKNTGNINLLLHQKLLNEKNASLLDHNIEAWPPIFNNGNNLAYNQNSILSTNTINSDKQLSKELPIRISPDTIDHTYNNVRNSAFGLNLNENQNNIHIHTIAVPATFSNLNNGVDNNDYIRPHNTQSNDYMNIEISQVGQVSTTFENGYKTPQDSRYLNGVVKEPSFYLNSKYKQPVISTIGVNFDSGYDYNDTSSTTLISNNPYVQSAPGSGNVNLNTDYIKSSSLTAINAEQNLSRNNINSRLRPPIAPFSNIKVMPTIHKHIYFHIPPPEIEEPQKLNPSPSVLKKDYNILFIKMPPHASKSHLVDINKRIAQTAVEEKTIIYVLVKKPEAPESIILPTPNRSQHQVFFVKYNGSPFDIASQVNDEIEETGSVDSIVPLAPGLVNGLK